MNKKLNFTIIITSIITILTFIFTSYQDIQNEKKLFNDYLKNLEYSIKKEYKNTLKESVEITLAFIKSTEERIIKNNTKLLNIELVKIRKEINKNNLEKYIQNYKHPFIKITKEETSNKIQNIFFINGEKIHISVTDQRVDNILISSVKEFLYKNIRNDKRYIWINKVINFDGGDNYAIRLVHPNLKSTENIFLSTKAKDIKGNHPYLDELNGVKKDGEVYFEYFFKELNSDKISQKLSYAKLYKDKNWIIATGIPLTNLNFEIEKRSKTITKNYARHFQEMLFYEITVISFFIILLIIMKSKITQYFNENKQLKDELAKKLALIENKANKFFDLSINILFILDIKGNILQINKASKAILGYEPEELENTYFLDLVHPDDVTRTINEIKHLIDGGIVEYFENRYQHKDGTYRTLAWSANSDLYNNFLYISAQDITEAKRKIENYSKELEKHKEHLQDLVDERTMKLEKTIVNLKDTQDKLIESEKMASLGGLVAGVAHEINTPIGICVTGITHFSKISKEIAEEYKVNKLNKTDFEDYLATTADLAKMMNINLIKTANLITSFKQIAVDQTSEEKRKFNLKKYTKDILFSLNSVTKITNIKINITGENDIVINSYPGAYAQIITNLIMNSIIHAYKENEEGQIDINIFKAQSNIKIIFKDDGEGIEKDNLGKIFNPFFTTNREHGGSGLGLNIIYNIITQQLNGTITCTSQINQWTQFEITIPNS